MACEAIFGVGEVIPVDHREPITVRVLNGRNGLPVAHLRLLLVAGYDQNDIDRHLWLEEASTNTEGEVRVPKGLVNFPYFEVALKGAKLCSARIVFNMGRIRNDGQNAPNRCGSIAPAEQPGVLILFASRGVAAGALAMQPPIPLKDGDWVNPPDMPGSPPPRYPTQLPNEIEALCDHELVRQPAGMQPLGEEPPSPAAQAPSGTVDSPDSYQEMCLPEP